MTAIWPFINSGGSSIQLSSDFESTDRTEKERHHGEEDFHALMRKASGQGRR
jgi:hypothetical protein